MADNEDRTPDPVDIHVGNQVRQIRKQLGISQEMLATALGITFQQVQKYERGANRISASKLYGIAKVFKVKVGTFFEGLPEADGEGDVVSEIAAFTEKAKAAASEVPAILQIGDLSPIRKRAINNLIISMVEDDQDSAAA